MGFHQAADNRNPFCERRFRLLSRRFRSATATWTTHRASTCCTALSSLRAAVDSERCQLLRGSRTVSQSRARIHQRPFTAIAAGRIHADSRWTDGRAGRRQSRASLRGWTSLGVGVFKPFPKARCSSRLSTLMFSMSGGEEHCEPHKARTGCSMWASVRGSKCVVV